jgi:hypothetical protein
MILERRIANSGRSLLVSSVAVQIAAIEAVLHETPGAT